VDRPAIALSEEVKAARKLLRSGSMFVVVFTTVVGGYVVGGILIDSVTALMADAPVIRIYAGSVLMPVVTAIAVATILTLILKALPAPPAVVKSAQRWGTLIIFLSMPVLAFVLFAARPLQQHYMPKRGYTECNALQGNPTIWFTDWIKNPEWCVRGKDRAWVFEQARAAQENPAKVNATN
jgi:hypothetical protein